MQIVTAALVAGAMGCTGALAQMATDAQFVDNEGQPVGVAILSASPHGTLMRIEIVAGTLEPGWHGVHLHANADCSDHEAFQAAGGHVSHEERAHGLLNPDGPHEGDLPNIHAGEDGSATAEMFTTLITLDGDDGILGGDGSAIVIHADEDDHTSQPIGGAGDRVACAEVR